jgi:hypothetical protein
MNKSKILVVVTMAAMIAFGTAANAKVTVERVSYHGWVDSYRLTAGNHSLVVVPEIGGRIMEYSVGGHNVIWENEDEYGRTYPISKDWHNYGGYKTWVAPQESWGWPPDPLIDFGKANVEVLQNPQGLPVLRVTGAPGSDSGLLFIKEISMDENGEVRLKQIMQNIGGKTITNSIWDLTQTRTPCFVAYPLKAHSRFQDGVNYLMSESKNSSQFNVKDGLCIISYQGDVGKVASDSDGPWMAWFSGDLAYVKLFDPMRKGSDYPEGGCSVEVFTSEAKVGYLGMELLGPLVTLKPGAKTEFSETWRIIKLSQPVRDENWIPKTVKGLRGKGLIP